MPWNVSITDCRSNKGSLSRNTEHFRSWLHFVIIYNSSIVFKNYKYDINVLISIEIARFIPKCTWCFVDLAFTFFLVCLIHLFSLLTITFWKKNQYIPRPVTIAIIYSLVEHDFIVSYCKMPIILLCYTAISNFQRNCFVC